MTVIKVKIWYWVVRHLPHKLLYFCYMWVVSYATTGKYSSTVVTELTVMDAINRYSNDYNVK
jgi:hypothetical protein